MHLTINHCASFMEAVGNHKKYRSFSPIATRHKRESYGEYIRENRKSKWQYRVERIKLEAAHCSYEHLEHRL